MRGFTAGGSTEYRTATNRSRADEKMEGGKIIRRSQHVFTEGKSCLTNLINFYDKMTGLVDEGRGGAIVHLDFCKIFDTVSHKILIEKLLMYWLDVQTAGWT
ncbi:hypothetical protein QYF61_021372 [Mycteria americana]|uniref:Reverse transcriptase domain-containing protein n=1 Tax=Mycteria americana TaxID=33587 RepID=A0AAN7RQT7_MYCAM|nr:hypothetical protein QYF61_021372 [Mycteria americana]